MKRDSVTNKHALWWSIAALIILAVLFLIPLWQEAQKKTLGEVPRSYKEDTANGDIPYRQLTWDDFQTVSRGSGGYYAYTTTYIRWNYLTKTTESEGQFRTQVTSITIRSGLNSGKSWKLRGIGQNDLAQLLLHEQGHLDINEIQARTLRQMKLSDWPIGVGSSSSAAKANLKTMLDQICNAALDEGRRQHALYDKETDHGKDDDSQGRWAAEISGNLGDDP